VAVNSYDFDQKTTFTDKIWKKCIPQRLLSKSHFILVIHVWEFVQANFVCVLANYTRYILLRRRKQNLYNLLQRIVRQTSIMLFHRELREQYQQLIS
jgi:hypothetical protein